MDIIKILNTIRDNSSDLYQKRVPQLTKDNLAEVGNPILEYEALTNEFLGALVNRIAFTEVSNRRFINPLAVLKGHAKPFGTDVEEIYTNPIKAVTYNGSQTDDMLKVTKPDTKTMFHRDNRRDKYPVSITEPELQRAFTSFDEMGSFIQSIIDAMYSGDEIDEFILMKNVISSAIAEGKMKSVEVEYTGDEASCKGLVKLMKTLSLNFKFPSGAYNGYNELNKEGIAAGTTTEAITWTPVENQVVILRADVEASTDVEVLAKAFNMDKTDFLKRKFVVDSFGDADTLAVLCDEKVFKFRDILYKTASFHNGSNLVTNYWLHHHQSLSLSLFGNAMAFKEKAVAETTEE